MIRRAGRALADTGSDVVNGLCARLGRTILLAVVFAIGAGGFVTAVGVSQTAAQQVTQRLTPSDLDEVVARPLIAQDGGGTAERLPVDAGARARSIPDVVGAAVGWQVDGSVSAITLRPQPVGVPAPDHAPPLFGADRQWLQLAQAVEVPAGADWQLTNGPAVHNAVLLGSTAARSLGISQAGPGKVVWIAGRRFDVVGIIRLAPRRPDLLKSAVVAPGAAQLVAEGTASATLVVRTKPGHARAVADVLAQVVRPDRPGAVRVDPVIDLHHLRRGVATDLDRLVALASLLVLVLAGLAIANAMVVSVLTRRGEIGLRRAMGSSRSQIAQLFLAEGALVGLTGGLLGVALGLTAIAAIAWTRSWTPVMSTGLIPVGVVSGSVVGVVFAAYPAWRATRIQPAEAVRHQG